MDGKDEYFIEVILDSQIYHCKLQYLVKCIVYDIPELEPAELHSESQAVDQFHEKNPDKSGPLLEAT